MANMLSTIIKIKIENQPTAQNANISGYLQDNQQIRINECK